MNGKSLSKVFGPPKNKQNCPRNCETYKLATKPNRSLIKNVVYEIKCVTCGTIYIGETSRTIGTQIKEHLTMEKQTVFKHYHPIRNVQEIRSLGGFCIQIYEMTRNKGISRLLKYRTNLKTLWMVVLGEQFVYRTILTYN